MLCIPHRDRLLEHPQRTHTIGNTNLKHNNKNANKCFHVIILLNALPLPFLFHMRELSLMDEKKFVPQLLLKSIREKGFPIFRVHHCHC